MREYLRELRDRWDDAYWRLDHPEVTAAFLAILTGLIGLFFTWLGTRLQQKAAAE